MNDTQTIYTFFFGLYFAVITTSVSKFHLFDTPVMWHEKCEFYKSKAFLRFIYSNLVLNFFPLLFFFCTLKLLGNHEGYLSFENGIHIYRLFLRWLLILFLSMIGQGFYRILYGSLLLKRKGEFLFYNYKYYSNKKNGLST